MENEKKEKDMAGCDCACDCGDNCHCEDGACDCGDDCACEDDCACHCGEPEHAHKHAHKHEHKQKCLCGAEGKCSGKGLFGLIILGFGVLYLGKNMGWWSFDMNWSIFWPVVLILCGFMIIIKSRRK